MKAKSTKKKKQPVANKVTGGKWGNLVALAIPLLLLLLIEGALILFDYGATPPLFVSTPDESSKYYGINLDVAQRYFRESEQAPRPRKDLFLKEKPDNGYRIFVLGGSTAAGFPYGNNVTFPRILQQRLDDIFPNRYIEVVNMAMSAVNSYTLLDFVDEILAQQPDAFLVYAGHNEFYGALGVSSNESLGSQRWLVQTYLNLKSWRSFQLLINTIRGISGWFAAEQSSNPTATMMTRIVKDKSILLDSPTYQAGAQQFQANLTEIIERVQAAGLPILIGNLVSNVRDHQPFQSLAGDGLPGAMQVYRDAKAFERTGQWSQARNGYNRAKDLDVVRFRASEGFNQIIHDVAVQYELPLVDVLTRFESESANRLIGDNLMTEHLHPNIDGYFLMAEEFLKEMRKAGLIEQQWPERIRPSRYYRENWGYSALDSTHASLTVQHLKGGWPFRSDGAPNRFLQAYRAETDVERVAIEVLRHPQMTLEQGRITLARQYQEQGKLAAAAEELKALVYTTPQVERFYPPAVSALLSASKFQEALILLQRSLKFGESAFAYKWIGQIYLMENRTAEGIEMLRKSLRLKSGDPQVVFNLARALYKSGERERGDKLLEQLKASSGNEAQVEQLEAYKQSLGQPK